MIDVKNHLYRNYIERKKLEVIDNLLDLDNNIVICPYLITKIDSIKQLSFDKKELEIYAEKLNDVINLIDCEYTKNGGFTSKKEKIIEIELQLSIELKLERICNDLYY